MSTLNWFWALEYIRARDCIREFQHAGYEVPASIIRSVEEAEFNMVNNRKADGTWN